MKLYKLERTALVDIHADVYNETVYYLEDKGIIDAVGKFTPIDSRDWREEDIAKVKRFIANPIQPKTLVGCLHYLRVLAEIELTEEDAQPYLDAITKSNEAKLGESKQLEKLVSKFS